MLTEEARSTVQTLHVAKETFIAAPIEIVWDSILEAQGHFAELKLKIEPWVGGRWYRDLGNNAGHLWGHVQVIKPPKLLELVGPMMMSYPVASHVQYRLTQEAGGTKLALVHQAMGLLAEDHMQGVQKGWGQLMEEVKKAAEKRASR